MWCEWDNRTLWTVIRGVFVTISCPTIRGRLRGTMRAVLAVAALITAGPGHAAYEAGAAKLEITPPPGVPLNGYLDRWGRGAVSVHDPVWARCLYLSDGTTSVFWVVTDLCVVNRELRERVLELVPQELAATPLVLSATHNHSGQGGMIKNLLFRSVSGRFVPELLETTASRIVEVMRAAYAGRRRAVAGYTTFTQSDLSANRRFADGPTDPQVGVIRVEDPDGRPIAILANFAAHPTTVGGDDMLTISADYPGFFYTELERLAGEGCVALFTNGAEGNQCCGNPTQAQGWERTRSIGVLLAERVYAAAQDIVCAEAPLRFVTSSPALPPAIAATLFPDETTLQMLESGDLVLTFFPGEPCVEIGLELRRRAIQQGYEAQFTVALSNDHLMYFVPRALYPKMIYESGMNFYGPRIEDWFYREFGRLINWGRPADPDPPPAPASVTALPGGAHALFAGSPEQMGRQRGGAFQKELQRAFDAHVAQPCAAGELIPKAGLWRFAPPFLDVTALALLRLGIGARPLLEKLDEHLLIELEGVAEAAHMPFDAVWLLQCLPNIVERGDVEELYRSPFCTMFAVVGDRAGADDVLVGRTFDSASDEAPVVFEFHPVSGRRWIQVGFPWALGAHSGMNDAGLVVCVESAPELGRSAPESLPVELLVRTMLERAGSVDEAAAMALDAPGLHGYRILLAAPSRGVSRPPTVNAHANARLVSCGLTPAVKLPSEGMLLGVDPDTEAPDADTKARYERIRALLRSERIAAPEKIRGMLMDTEGGLEGRARICNADTRYAVVFEPKARRVSVSFRRPDGPMSEYTEYALGKDAR